MGLRTVSMHLLWTAQSHLTHIVEENVKKIYPSKKTIYLKDKKRSVQFWKKD